MNLLKENFRLGDLLLIKLKNLKNEFVIVLSDQLESPNKLEAYKDYKVYYVLDKNLRICSLFVSKQAKIKSVLTYYANELFYISDIEIITTFSECF